MRLGRPRIQLPVTGSTMDDARELADVGMAEGTIVIADRQLAGRGRSGRAWVTPDGALAMSLILRPTREPARWGLLPLVIGSAIADLAISYGADAGVKWPNDVLVRGRKLAGILMEGRQAAPGVAPHVIVGIGVNVGPDGVPPIGISLTEAAFRPFTVADILDPLLRAIESRYRAFEQGNDDALLAEWRQLSITLGSDVEAADLSVRGRAVEVDGTGALVLETADGRVTVNAGDVHILRRA